MKNVLMCSMFLGFIFFLGHASASPDGYGHGSGTLTNHGDGTYTLTVGGTTEHFNSKEAAAQAVKQAAASGISIQISAPDDRSH